MPAASSNELLFITDDELRQNLLGDLGAITQALSNGEWKAATVLAGALVEALLLWKLQQDSTKARRAASAATGPLDRWDLKDYIEVAAELTIINGNTVAQAKIAKDFRNLIHPGRAARLGQVCDRGTALSAVAAVHLVIRDLSVVGRMASPTRDRLA